MMKKTLQVTIFALLSLLLPLAAWGQSLDYSRSKCDVNADGEINIADVNMVIDAIFGGGEADEPQAMTVTVCGVSFKMVPVAGGTFTMGATAEQGSDAWEGEKPPHQVTLSDYSIGETEVTQELWQAVMGSNPSESTGNLQRPVEQVTWGDCQTFIAKLNELTGKTFRLPTEAEWEYAARGGSKSKGYMYAGSNDIDAVAWYVNNSFALGSSSPVAAKAPNELGLYDMSGNVWEWCQDWYGGYASSPQDNPAGPSAGFYHVFRGGCWDYDAVWCRVSFRNFNTPSYRNYGLGLRLAL